MSDGDTEFQPVHMRWFRLRWHQSRACLILVSIPLIGCRSFGPTTVEGDHFSFNDAISKSSNEQLLLNLVRLQSGKPIYCVEIASMISQYRLATNAEISRKHNDLHGSFGPALRAAFPNKDDPVPDPTTVTTVRANLAYAQKPTITYKPVEGGAISEDFLSPLSAETVTRLVQSGWGIDRVFFCCVQRVNGISNRRWVDGQESWIDKGEFSRLIDLLKELHQDGDIRFDEEVDAKYLVLPAESTNHSGELAELRKLLSYPAQGTLRLRIVANQDQSAPDQIAVQTRSVNAIMSALAWENIAGSDVDNDQNSGSWLCLHKSLVPQKDVFAQVRFDGRWHYVSKDDWRSKRTFAMVSSLFTMLNSSHTGDSDK